MTQCQKNIPEPGTHRVSQCSRPATCERDGRRYCFQHDPEAVAARRAVRDKKQGEHSAASQLRVRIAAHRITSFEPMRDALQLVVTAPGFGSLGAATRTLAMEALRMANSGPDVEKIQ